MLLYNMCDLSQKLGEYLCKHFVFMNYDIIRHAVQYNTACKIVLMKFARS